MSKKKAMSHIVLKTNSTTNGHGVDGKQMVASLVQLLELAVARAVETVVVLRGQAKKEKRGALKTVETLNSYRKMQRVPPSKSLARVSSAKSLPTVKSSALIQSSVARVIVGKTVQRESAGEMKTFASGEAATRAVGLSLR